MSTHTLAQPVAAPQAERRTVPAAVILVVELAAYGVAEPVIPRGDWELADWECLARRAGA